MSKIIISGKITAISLLLLGIIHDIATFTPLIQEGLECLSKPDLDAMVYMSLICGTSLILSGGLLFTLLNKADRFTWVSTPILFIGSFLCLNGILSVFYMSDNPFAWITFILGIISLSISILIKRESVR
ncbi:hypothetical protein [Dysgonomonas macrotermitis]|uniref:MerC mercury resistance protein n=1 Tax=Dysgonomonas macrotermitis TaxID=1346286 RepID=A0A1M4YNR7_9BACT|nr:hypothetical protein [Dysgonomonas macrotermitis]SHF07036.1 hypothetical protein SAMN05444362_103219 [Dysgonomonas macrotermitis]